MATTNSAGYGGGAGGKLPTKPSRHPQTTPYDRPPTALRNTSLLSRLVVDPASKLISSTAHKLFSFVHRHRLLPPPDNGVDPSQNQSGYVTTDDSPRTQERNKNEGNTNINGSVTDGVSELEHILRQKMFTRSEIDRITVLLQSRSVDEAGIAGQRSFYSRPCELPADLIPAVISKVNHDDDIASPAELAKTYMGSRSRIGSPSVSARCNPAVRKETHTLATFQSHRAIMQTPFSTLGTSQNGFVTPRSQGRSRLYSMSRTPYSRVLSADKDLKRRCSVLENDSGAVGPIRRLRQKHNFLHSKSTGQSSSRTTSEQGETSLHYFSKPQEDKGDKGIPVSSSHVSSKSIDIGNKILQEIEKMTPPKKMRAFEDRLENTHYTPMEFSISAERGVGSVAHRSPPEPIMNKTNEFSASSVKQIATLVSDKVVIAASTVGFGLKSDKVSSASLVSSSVMEAQQTSSAFALPTGATDAGIKCNGSMDVLTNSVVSATRMGDFATAAISGSANSLTNSAAFPSFQSVAASAGTSSITIQSSRFGATTSSSTNNQLQTPEVFSQPKTESMPSQPNASGSSSLAVSSGYALGTTSISAPSNGSFPGNSLGAPSSSAAPFSNGSSVFAFKTSSISPPANGSSASATPASFFSFASAASTPAANTPQASQPAFGGRSSVFAFGSTASPPSTSGFGRANGAPAPAPSVANPFQFGSQQNQPAAPKRPFQTSDNSNGGVLSLGSGGNDKSKRRILKIDRNRKK